MSLETKCMHACACTRTDRHVHTRIHIHTQTHKFFQNRPCGEFEAAPRIEADDNECAILCQRCSARCSTLTSSSSIASLTPGTFSQTVLLSSGSNTGRHEAVC